MDESCQSSLTPTLLAQSAQNPNHAELPEILPVDWTMNKILINLRKPSDQAVGSSNGNTVGVKDLCCNQAASLSFSKSSDLSSSSEIPSPRDEPSTIDSQGSLQLELPLGDPEASLDAAAQKVETLHT
jgi:hypothetical protein